MAEEFVRALGQDLLGRLGWHLGVKNPGLMVVDDYKPVRFPDNGCWQRRFRLLKKLSQLGEFEKVGDLLGAGDMEREGATVASGFEVTVGLLGDCAQLTQQDIDVMPDEIVRRGMVKYRFVGLEL